MIKPTNKVAIVAGNRLGDGLIIQVITYNLYLQGYEVTLFNTPLLTLKNWFPWANIQPHFPQEMTSTTLENFDTLIFQHHNRHARESIPGNQQRLVLYGDALYMQRKPLVDIYLEFCQKILKLENLIRSNGIEIPSHLNYREHKKRVLVHPMSLCPEKNWPKEKFILLGKELISMGYEPKFTVSPNEKEDWLDLKEHGLDLVVFPKLSELASYIYESGYMIGNDSGIAHLTSSVQIPSLALFIRPGVAKRWRPSFFPSRAVLPWLHLPGPKLQERFWKQIISVPYVLRQFKKTVVAYP